VSTSLRSPDTNSQVEPATPMEAAIAEAAQLAGDRSPDAVALLRENVRLQCLHPNEYVAYIDCWTVQGDLRSLVRRVVAHSPSLSELYHDLAALPSHDCAAVIIDYAADVNQELLDNRGQLDPGHG
jgi:hypothetical protein